MTLSQQIAQSLAELKGFSSPSPEVARWTGEQGLSVEIGFTGVDSLSCAFRELRLAADALCAAPIDSLQAWADQLCRRVTYLLEQLGPLEVDVPAQTVLVRSNPPTKDADRTSYYEMTVRAPGVVSLRRYVRDGEADRQAVDLVMTHEVLQRLVRDIVEAVPCTSGIPA
jgi:hypothetical protein